MATSTEVSMEIVQVQSQSPGPKTNNVIKKKKPTYGANYCALCSNHSKKVINGQKISFHRFPNKEDVRRVWIQRCKLRRQGFKFGSWSTTRLCGTHFVGGRGPTPDDPYPVFFGDKTFDKSVSICF